MMITISLGVFELLRRVNRDEQDAADAPALQSDSGS